MQARVREGSLTSKLGCVVLRALKMRLAHVWRPNRHPLSAQRRMGIPLAHDHFFDSFDWTEPPVSRRLGTTIIQGRGKRPSPLTETPRTLGDYNRLGSDDVLPLWLTI